MAASSSPEKSAPRLLDKAEILRITGVTYPTVWKMMRRGEFPRGRVFGGQTRWLSTEVDEWLRKLPKRRLKGDAATPRALPAPAPEASA